jgi:hypothetical protein
MTGSAASHIVADQSEVFAFLADPATHAAPTRRIDTHGAVVVLAGPHAYKAKRAVRFPFMDFSTLDKRRAACEAEVAVNAPHAPGLYEGVVAVTRRPDGSLALGGEGAPVEWVVRMRRFDEDATLDKVADRGGLDSAVIASLAETLLASHREAPLRDAGPAVAALERYAAENRAAFAESPDLFPPGMAAALTQVVAHELARLRPLLLARGAAGRVRRCHGDLHLRNIVLLDGRPTLFDAIEFDESIATGDVLYDLAFLLMDLLERDLRGEANALLNRYLWMSDPVDLAGLAALPVFLSLRAAIRAKVVAAGLDSLQGVAREAAAREARRYFELAQTVLRPAQPRLVAIGGLSGTGKSVLAAALAPGLGRPPGAIHLRSDIVRKRLMGARESERLPEQAYGAGRSEAVYATLRDEALSVLAAGSCAIVDAVHGRPAEREAIAQVARNAGVPFCGLWLAAPVDLRVARVETRRGDASDADATVVRRQETIDVGRIDWPTLDATAPVADLADRAAQAADAGRNGAALFFGRRP